MRKVVFVTDRIATGAAWIGVGLTIALMVMYTIDVVGRLAFSWQMRGTFEVAQFMLCILAFGSYGYTQITRGHIQVSFVTNMMPRNLRYGTYGVGYILCAIMGLITTYALWSSGQHAFMMDKYTTVLELPYGPLYSANAVLMMVFVLTLVVDAVRCFLAMGGNEEAQASMSQVSL